MRRQPMAVAFVLSLAGAAIVAARPGFGAIHWGPIVVGSTLTAAMTGIVASVLQFLPQRLFAPFTVLAAVAVALLVFALLKVGAIWLGPVPTPMAVVWPSASAAGLIAARAAGMRLPVVRIRRSR